jgi:hypothetical protein
VKTRLDQAFIYAALIGAQRATALQQQGNAVEGRTAAPRVRLHPGRGTIIEPNIVTHDKLL